MTKALHMPVLIRIGSVQTLTRALDTGICQEPGEPTLYFVF